jgi:hypothetical protein
MSHSRFEQARRFFSFPGGLLCAAAHIAVKMPNRQFAVHRYRWGSAFNCLGRRFLVLSYELLDHWMSFFTP